MKMIEAREKLKDHDPYISSSECDLCGPHIDIHCCKDFDEDQTNADSLVEHILSVLFPE